MKKLLFFFSIFFLLFFSTTAFADDTEINPDRSGLVAELGIGYSSSDAGSILPTIGYQFTPMFGLYLDAIFRFGQDNPDYSYNLAIVPTFHTRISNEALVSIGLGLGYEYYRSKCEPDIIQDPIIPKTPIDTHTIKAFVVKPKLAVDFFLTKQIYLGLGVDIPVYFGTVHKDRPRYYALHMSDGTVRMKERNEYKDEDARGAHFDAFVHIGCKFGE